MLPQEWQEEIVFAFLVSSPASKNLDSQTAAFSSVKSQL
jgi:hypothetical protein